MGCNDCNAKRPSGSNFCGGAPPAWTRLWATPRQGAEPPSPRLGINGSWRRGRGRQLSHRPERLRH
eukprot:14917192-Alexandrium_andersonii.AAC.1